MPRRSAISSVHAFTLVEVLVVLVLLTLLLGVTGTILVNTVRTQNVVTESVGAAERRGLLLRRLRDDLQGMAAIDDPGLTLTPSPQTELSFRALVGFEPGDGSLHLPQRPAEVRYRTEVAPSGVNVDRVVLDLTDETKRPHQECVAADLEEFQLEVLTEEGWQDSLDPTTKETASLLRITYRLADEDRPVTAVVEIGDHE